MYVTVFFGSMTFGSLIWGEAAGVLGLPATHIVAAAGALAAIPLTRRWRLQSGAALDLTPSMDWPEPVIAASVAGDAGPVLVTVEYRVEPSKRSLFLRALAELARERKRDGAYDWGIFEDAAEPGRFTETFLVESWVEHLRQHERVTKADQIIQRRVRHLLGADPVVKHFISADPRG
jgi:quinol monooxygenase YgiN